MPALVESMMYVREKPWHGLGTRVEEAPTSTDALRMAGLDWSVVQRNIQVCGGAKIKNYKANVRDSDGTVLGVVSDRYKIVQNAEAFEFTDSLIGGEVRYETAGRRPGRAGGTGCAEAGIRTGAFENEGSKPVRK